jgi:TRAP transporter 4TM/12TM fusion protein
MSLLPAILYFVSVLLYVHLLAVKQNMVASSGGPRAAQMLKDGAPFLLPLALITGLLVTNYSPVLVGSAGCAAVVFAAMMWGPPGLGFKKIGSALKDGALMAIPISSACAVAGLVVGTIGQTGIGLQFTESVVDLASGQLWLALGLIAFAALVLGMGLPVTAAYIVLAVMAGPALQEMGLPLITAHMVIFWLSQTSNITPPIALAAFAGAGIAGASPLKTAVRSFKFASGFFVIPLMMVYSPLLLTADNTWFDVFLAAGFTLGLIVCLAGLVEGYLVRPLGMGSRVFAAGAIVALLPDDMRFRTVGMLMCAVLLVWNALGSRGIRGISAP